MRFETLDGWLNWQESLHPNEIELGLDRVSQVLDRLDFENPNFIVITVAGTNGKGSCVAMLQSILLAAGYRVGTYTSPHLLKYNERIQINGQSISDETLCEAFERVDQARDNVLLTYFEFGTLAAIDILQKENVDIAILEVGLGGRLDAVNVLNADVSLITTIDIDHESWLGKGRETIAREKAGILRPGQAAVCADSDPPASLVEYADKLSTRLFIQGKDFEASFVKDNTGKKSWNWRGTDNQIMNLPLPALAGDFQVFNAAGVMEVLEQLYNKKFISEPVSEQAIINGLLTVSLPGRLQIIGDKPRQILDVAHNPQGACALAESLRQQNCPGKTRAVFAILVDKDIAGVIACLSDLVDNWYLAPLDVPRSADPEQFKTKLSRQTAHIFDDVNSAYQAALSDADAKDRIVVFGSFYTVAEVLSQAV